MLTLTKPTKIVARFTGNTLSHIGKMRQMWKKEQHLESDDYAKCNIFKVK